MKSKNAKREMEQMVIELQKKWAAGYVWPVDSDFYCILVIYIYI